jgi:hypothetical protein
MQVLDCKTWLEHDMEETTFFEGYVHGKHRTQVTACYQAGEAEGCCLVDSKSELMSIWLVAMGGVIWCCNQCMRPCVMGTHRDRELYMTCWLYKPQV